MSREIEFRAWSKSYKEIVKVDLLGKNKVLSSRTWFDFDDIELMQYVGIKDKNGVKIFEGDIVKMQTRGFDNKIITCKGVVNFFKTETCFVIELKNININIHEDAQYLYEVVGNIYENKELLEDE